MIDFERKGWIPQSGEMLYVAHAITKGKFIRAYYVCFYKGCHYVTTPTHKRYRIHVRHTAMKPIITVAMQSTESA